MMKMAKYRSIKGFLKILSINFVISLFEAALFIVYIGLETGRWNWSNMLSNIFILTQTSFISMKYMLTTGKIKVDDD